MTRHDDHVTISRMVFALLLKYAHDTEAFISCLEQCVTCTTWHAIARQDKKVHARRGIGRVKRVRFAWQSRLKV